MSLHDEINPATLQWLRAARRLSPNLGDEFQKNVATAHAALTETEGKRAVISLVKANLLSFRPDDFVVLTSDAMEWIDRLIAEEGASKEASSQRSQ